VLLTTARHGLNPLISLDACADNSGTPPADEIESFQERHLPPPRGEEHPGQQAPQPGPDDDGAVSVCRHERP